MQAVENIKQEAVVTCPHCKTPFKINAENIKNGWHHFVFKCPVCNEVNCIPRCEIIE